MVGKRRTRRTQVSKEDDKAKFRFCGGRAKKGKATPEQLAQCALDALLERPVTAQKKARWEG